MLYTWTCCAGNERPDEAPGVLGSWGEGLLIFRALGSTGNCFRGAGQLAHTFGDLRRTAKNEENKFQGLGEIRALFLGIKGAQTPVSSP